MRRFVSLFICYFIFFITNAIAQDIKYIQLLDQVKETPLNPQSLRSMASETDAYLLVRANEKENSFKGNPAVVREIGDNYFIVNSDFFSSGTGQSKVEEVWQVNDLWKFAPDFFKDQYRGKQVFSVRSLNPPETIKKLSTIPSIQIIHNRRGLIRLRCTEELLRNEVLNLREVIYIGHESLHPKTESRVNDNNLNPNSINQIHHEFPELNGKGMVLSIQEPLFDAEDMDLRGRIIPSHLQAEYIDQHTTEMATIAAGAGNSYITGKGVAWAANLTSSDYADVLPDQDEDYRSLNAWVQNHSYGTAIENFYGTLAEAFDKSANLNTNLLHIISAGNMGLEEGTGSYEGIKGFANLTGNFKMAKNILTIGSVDTLGRHVYFSSAGPAYDGRVKPELSAYSTAGSSNSTALVSGLSLLLQQAFLEQNDSLPPSALLKAILINSASDAGPEGVDFLTGYGNVNGYRTLTNLKEGNYFSGKISVAERKEFSLTVPENARNLKVTIVWNDPAALPNSANALVNDLDMKLLDAQQTTWLPWVLNSEPEKEQLRQKAKRKEDHLNNIEQISLEFPEAGTYQISITGFEVPDGPQEFFIAYQWEEGDQFEWTFPTGSDNMPYNGETTGYLRWENTFEEKTGRLEWSKDGGKTWQLLESQILLENEHYRWETPLLNTTALVRMAIGDKVFMTDLFTISTPVQAGIGFNCGDSILLDWNNKEEVQAYQVFAMGEERMEYIGSTSDTVMVLRKSELPSAYLSVQPVLAGGAKGLKSIAFDYRLQGNSCYLVSFYSESSAGEGIYLHLGLGTTFEIGSLLVERKVEGGWETMQIVPNPQKPQLQFLDQQPKQGLNTYRATIRLLNGKEIVSLAEHNYYLSEMPFLVFPNPVSKGEELRVFSKPLEKPFSFRLFNQTAQLVLEKNISQERAYFPLNGLPAGVYFYTIHQENQQYKGKIFISE